MTDNTTPSRPTLGQMLNEKLFEPSPLVKYQVGSRPNDDESIYDELQFSDVLALYYGDAVKEDKDKARRWLNFANWVCDYYMLNKDDEASTEAIYGHAWRMTEIPEEYSREKILEIMREVASRKDGVASSDARQWLEAYFNPDERESLFAKR